MRLTVLFLLGAVCALLQGCMFGNTCEPDLHRAFCDGTSLWYCPEPGVDQLFAPRWAERDCTEAGNVCVEVQGGALCARSPTPEPACEAGPGKVCRTPTEQITCVEGGYFNRSERCLSCTDDPSTCEGGWWWACTEDAGCVEGLFCSPERKQCVGPGWL